MGSIREHRGKHQARYRDPNGRLRSKSFDRKSDARAFLAGIETDKRRGEWIDPSLGRVLFADYAEGYYGSLAHLRSSTREKVAGHLRTHILPRFGDQRMVEVTPAAVRGFVSGLTASGLAPGTVRSVFGTFSRILGTAAVDGVIVRSPCIGVDLPRERRTEMHFLNAQEVARLAEEIGPRYSTLVYFAAYTGLRWGELAGLHVENVNPLRGTVTVEQSLSEINGHLELGPTKTGKPRSVSLPRFLAETLAEHLRMSRSP